jgi:two-component system NtrC family sensor kinase
MRFKHTIAFRLFLLIAAVATVILATFTAVSIRIQRSDAMDQVLLSAARISDVIARSTRHSMMLNEKEDVQTIITSIGEEQGIEGIRIYNKQGTVVFATALEHRGEQADMSAEACITCHVPGQLANPHPEGDELSRIFTPAGGSRVLGLITPIRNEAACSDAACHAHPPEKTILGVLDVKMSLASIDRRIEESTTQLILLSIVAVLLVSLISGGFIWTVVHKPVRTLHSAMYRAGRGALNHKVEVRSRTELGELAEQFNAMTSDLAHARQEITNWSATLEQKVARKTEELESAHRHILQVEKMASLGNLAASVAHELNNPLEGILTFAKLLAKRIRRSSLPAEDIATYSQDLTLVADEAARCGAIVKNLLLFARHEGDAFRQASVKTIVDRSVLLTAHHAKVHNVAVEVDIPQDVIIECNGNELEQVLIALLVNATESMSGAGSPGGKVNVTAGAHGPDHIRISVADSGVGMTEEIRAHIFEPFFTTKSNEKGVGLGLAVAYGIIQRHHGDIDVESSPGKGSTFAITLPVTQPASEQPATLSV